jgi:hypothetical protein
MKLRVEEPPEGYSADKVAIMVNERTGEIILIGCPKANAVAREIAAAVNKSDEEQAAQFRLQGEVTAPSPSSGGSWKPSTAN